MTDEPCPVATGGFTPGPEDLESVLEWFRHYDRLVLSGDIEAMADQALFPLNAVTDDASGNGSARTRSRESFIEDMRRTLPAPGEFSMEPVRTPHFLSASLVFVVTEGTMTVGGGSVQVRYGDLLVRHGGRWKFQTMAQGGASR
ncbi:nuclear transport factor 2 family protein [Streptomyces sp. NPDC057638]|uniref:nuclear transport factor 2 family protein n=1 Tax=Streptomyces sp. NPDC057638 TaxID=3346190 RepID=UPI00367D92DF